MKRLGGFWNEGAASLLNHLLEQKHLRVEDFAERVDVTPRAVRNWMRTETPPHRPTPDHLEQICAILEVPLDDFRRAAEHFHVTGTLPGYEPEPESAAPVSSASERELPPAPPPVLPRRRSLLLVALAVVAVAGVGLAFWFGVATRAAHSSSPIVTFDLPSESKDYDQAYGGDVSPDGTLIAFLARSKASGSRMLFVHSVADRSTRPLPGSEGNYTSFFWNTDSRSLFFVTKTELMKIVIADGVVDRVASVGEAVKGTINGNGTIVLGSRRGLLIIGANREVEVLTKPATNDIAHAWPQFLPDGDRVVFTITRRDGHSTTHILAATSVSHGAVRELFPVPSRASIVNDQLLYVRRDTLWARSFDTTTLKLSGAERTIASPVAADPLTGEAEFSASATTLLAAGSQKIPPLYKVSSKGVTEETITDPEDIQSVAVAHGGSEIAVIGRRGSEERAALWLCRTGEEPVRVPGESNPSSPLFSRDDRRLYYAAEAKSWANIYATSTLPGALPASVLLSSNEIVAPRDVSPDGRFLLFQQWHNRDGNLWYAPAEDLKSAKGFVSTPEDEGESARFSPDGRRVAFVAKRGSEFSVYLAPFPPQDSPPQRMTATDGWRARWSNDGREILFVRGASVMAVDVARHTLRQVFEMNREISLFEVAADGGFFVRETPLDSPRVVATVWWPRLAEHALNVEER